MRQSSPIQSNTRSAILLAALSFATLFSIPAHAASNEEACNMWSNMAQTFAQGRDAGVPLKEQYRKINTLVGKPGITPANIKLARVLASTAYKDFKNKTPEQVGQIALVGCLAN